MISVYVTCRNKKEGVKIAEELIRNNLAACVNLFPIGSVYSWEGKIKKAKEFAMFIKTNKSFKVIEKEIRKLHSYDIPCIEKINVDFNKKYKEWIGRELK